MTQKLEKLLGASGIPDPLGPGGLRHGDLLSYEGNALVLVISHLERMVADAKETLAQAERSVREVQDAGENIREVLDELPAKLIEITNLAKANANESAEQARTKAAFLFAAHAKSKLDEHAARATSEITEHGRLVLRAVQAGLQTKFEELRAKESKLNELMDALRASEKQKALRDRALAEMQRQESMRKTFLGRLRLAWEILWR